MSTDTNFRNMRDLISSNFPNLSPEDIEPHLNALFEKLEQRTLKNKLVSLEQFTNNYYKKATSDMKYKVHADILKDITTVLTGPAINDSSSNLFDDLMNRIDICQDALNNLWLSEFGQEQMNILLSIIDKFLGDKIGEFLTEDFESGRNEYNLFNSSDASPVINALTAWIECTDQLINRFWLKSWNKNDSKHHFTSNYVRRLRNRISNVIDLKLIEKQSYQLLCQDDVKILKARNPLKQITSSVILDIQDDGHQTIDEKNTEFGRLLRQFDHAIQPFLFEIVTHICNSLDFRTVTSITDVHIQMISKWAAIISKYHSYFDESNLINNILEGIKTNLRMVNRRFDGGFIPCQDDEDYDQIVDEIGWCNGMRNSIHNCKQILEKLKPVGANSNDHLKSIDRSIHTCYDSLEKIKSYTKEILANWCQVTESKVKKIFKPSNAVIKLDSIDKKFIVTFSDELDIILRTIRRLSSMGFLIPDQNKQQVAQIKNIKNHANELKKIAYFYNTADQQMIPSQRPMLLEIAIELETQVKKCQKITWQDLESLEEIMPEINRITTKFNTENQKLRQYEQLFLQKLGHLNQLEDLIEHEQKWAEKLGQIRNLTENIESIYGSVNAKSWLTDCEKRIGDCLAKAYKSSIPKILGSKMGESAITENAELVIISGELVFRPSIEIIEKRLIKNIENFAKIPENIHGLSSSSANRFPFKFISEKYKDKLSKAAGKTKATIDQLKSLATFYKGWFTTSGGEEGSGENNEILTDLQNFEKSIAPKCKSVTDFESNIRAIKNRGQEVERINDLEIVDCVKVDLVLMRASLHKHHNLWYEAILNVLKNRVTTPFEEVDRFLDSAFKQIAFQPRTAEETTLAAQEYSKIRSIAEEHQEKLDKSDEFLQLFQNIDSLSASRSVQRMNIIKERLSQLLISLETQCAGLEHTISKLKSEILNEKQIFEDSIKSFSTRFSIASKDALDNCALNFNRKNRANTRKWISDLNQFSEDLAQVNDDFEGLNKKCQAFGIDSPDAEIFNNLRDSVDDTKNIWQVFDDYDKKLVEFESKKWIVFRDNLSDFEEFLIGTDENMRKMQLDLKKSSNKAIIVDDEAKNVDLVNGKRSILLGILKEIENYRLAMYGYKIIKGEHLGESHWMELFRILNLPSSIQLTTLDFSHILDSTDTILSKIEQLKELNKRAIGEASARKAIRELEIWSSDCVFKFTKQRGGNLEIITEWAELISEIDEKSDLIASLQDSQYISKTQNLADQQKLWSSRLSDLDNAINLLNRIQKKWLYLEPVIMGGALPSEKPRFLVIDQQFRHNIMQFIHNDNRVISILNISSDFSTLLEQLNSCQTALTNHLENKRNIEPRFYFIGDDDLLELLGQARNATVFVQHLKKLFAGIHSCEFDKNKNLIISMKAYNGETVKLNQPIELSVNAEITIKKLSENMMVTLKSQLQNFVQNSTKIGENLKASEQILSTGSKIHLTTQIEQAITANAKGDNCQGLQAIFSNLNQKISKLSTFESNHVFEMDKINNFILELIQWRSLVEALIENKVNVLTDWNWIKQLRFYPDFKARILDTAAINYTFEYQGSTNKLVHGPLTDKCYLTLGLALHLGLGGCPYGPAGTGKTETVKALAVNLGRNCLVFNCDDGIDVKSMSRIFIGLVESGAWGCFDEFNRLDEVVLSALSSDIQTIQEAVKNKYKTFGLVNRKQNIKVNENCAIFITLNPKGKGYGGRQKLPDNLKQLFRPVAMAKTDSTLIAEVYLYTEGFTFAKKLAVKAVNLLDLSSNLLPQQSHYDWSLRALKPMLKTAGNMLRKYLKKTDAKHPDQILEEQIFVQSVKVNTLSKLTIDDRKLFLSILRNIFETTNSSVNRKIVEDLDIFAPENIQKTCRKLNYTYTDNLRTKLLELHEQLEQRMGVVVIGPTCSGKTTLWQILSNLLNASCQVINAKAMNRRKLLGSVNHDTREWTDGVLTLASRQAVLDYESSDFTKRVFIVCDSDIDPEWIEALNSVLDDNKLLTLPSGERIQFPLSGINFIFETHDLTPASPATVSRMGIIFMSESDVEIESLINSFNFDANAKFNAKELSALLNEILGNPSNKDNFIRSPISIAKDILSNLVKCVDNKEMAFIVSQSCFMNVDRVMGENKQFAVNLFNNIVNRYGLMVPDKNNPHDCYYYNGILHPINVAGFRGGPGKNNASVSANGLVQIHSLVSNSNYLSNLFKYSLQPIALISPNKSGRSSTISHALYNSGINASLAKLSCSYGTTASDLVQLLQKNCASAASGRILRPRKGERMVIVVENLDLCKKDSWNSCQIVNLLQQLIAHSGLYNAQQAWVSLERVQFVFILNPDYKTKITERLISLLRLVQGSQFTLAEKVQILSTNIGNAISNPSSIVLKEELSLTEILRLKHIDSNEKLSQEMNLLNQNFIQSDSHIFLNEKINMADALDNLKVIKRQFSREIRNLDNVCPLNTRFLNLYSWCYSALSATESSGGIILAGNAGSNRKEAASLAAYSLKYSIVGPRLGRIFNEKSIMNDLKTSLLNALSENQKTMFVLEDYIFTSQNTEKSFFIQERILTSLNYLLSTANLFATDSSQGSDGRDATGKQNGSGSSSSLNDTFQEQLSAIVAENFKSGTTLQQAISSHFKICLIMTNNLVDKVVMKNYPNVYKSLYLIRSTVTDNDLHSQISQDLNNSGLEFVSDGQKMDPEKRYNFCSQISFKLLEACNQIDHLSDPTARKRNRQPSGRSSSQTNGLQVNEKIPQIYKQLTSNFIKIYNCKFSSYNTSIKRFSEGLNKIKDAEKMVKILSEKASAQRVELSEKQKEADLALENISAAMSEVSEQKAKMQELSIKVEKEQDVIRVKQGEIQNQLKDVQPMIDAALGFGLENIY